MNTLIPSIDISQNMLQEDGFIQLKQILLNELRIELNLHSENALSFADLIDPVLCKSILLDFAARIQAVSLTCAGSMFMKYWGVPLLFPYFFAMLFRNIHLPWDISILSVELGENWHWDRHLNIRKSNLSVAYTDDDDFENLLKRILTDLNLIFHSIHRVAKVQKYLLWENTALRILQFYDSVHTQVNDEVLSRRIGQQRQYLCSLSAKYFDLKHNPFLILQQSKEIAPYQYRRKKCCFYFQLPESKQEYCSSCPLICKDKRDLDLCKIN